MLENIQPTAADDRLFYKYMSRGTARIVLENRTLRWSSPLAYNDPFDNQFNMHIDADAAEVKRRALEKIWESYNGGGPPLVNGGISRLVQALKRQRLTRRQIDSALGRAIDESLAAQDRLLTQLNEDIRPLARQNKILCLAQTPTSTLMWSYYAEGHNGVVLRFRSAPGVDSPWTAGRAVEYSAHMPGLVDAEGLADVFAGRGRIDGLGALRRLVFTKSTDWAHEQEWRIFSGAGRDPDADFDDAPFNAQELDGVIFGCKIPDADREAISAIARERYTHAALLKAVTRQREYGLEIQDA